MMKTADEIARAFRVCDERWDNLRAQAKSARGHRDIVILPSELRALMGIREELVRRDDEATWEELARVREHEIMDAEPGE